VTADKISIRNIKNVSGLDIEFEFPDSNIIVVTGKNGIGKTTVIKCFHLLSDPNIFSKSSGEHALCPDSRVSFSISGIQSFTFTYNENLRCLDSKDRLPHENTIVSELSIPFGARFLQYSKIAAFDSELRVNIASSDYNEATEVIEFLSQIYSSNRFTELKATKIKKNTFYFLLKDDDYYIREDHFSSGEFFLIQLYRLISSGARLILIDELDVALDAVAQVRLFAAIKPILQNNNSRLVVVSHSLAFMNTVDNDGLYYLESDSGLVSLESRSFSYIKSDLFGFTGFDRYILTEDDVLEGFIEYCIMHFSVRCYYKHITIGVAGVNQVQRLVEKNDRDQIFSDPSNLLCMVDGDVHESLSRSYSGQTRIIRSPVEDIERYVYSNRQALLPEIALPAFVESGNQKRASKTYWKWLIHDNGIPRNDLYRRIVEANLGDARQLIEEIKTFLEKARQ